jgi:large subunit ribosomal protein L25
MLALEVKERNAKEKAENLRSAGVLPAVFYGPKEKATPVAISQAEFDKIWREAGETTIITLKGIGEDKETLIHDVDVHPVTGRARHADFYVIERGKKVEVSVPLEFVGEAPAEKDGHIISRALYEVDIAVRPSELPQHFEIDISSLEKVGDHITVGDIKLPPSAELENDPEEIIASVKEYVEVQDETPETVAPEETEGDEEGGAGAPEEGEGGEEKKKDE